MSRCWWTLLALVAGLVAPSAAQAAIDSALGVPCTVQSDGVRFCGSNAPRSTSPAWDGTPIDVNIAFPPGPGGAHDGRYPLVMLFHGYGGGKLGLSRHAALARPRVRGLLDDRPRLQGVVRLGRLAGRRRRAHATRATCA